MPHRCIRCGKVYSESAIELVKGCRCGSGAFIYVKREADLDKISSVKWTPEIEEKLNKQYEKNGNKPVRFDVENVRFLKKGVFEFDLESLIIKRNPVIVRDTYGIYYVKLPKQKSVPKTSARASKKEKNEPLEE